jgi:alpha-glucosidase
MIFNTENMRKTLSSLLILFITIPLFSQAYYLPSPAGKISFSVNNATGLTYRVAFNNSDVISESALGFEFEGEEPLKGNFEVVTADRNTVLDTWKPVVKSKHEVIINSYNELTLVLREKSGAFRMLTLQVRVYDDGVAFRFTLPRAALIGDRKITRELTSFVVPGNPDAWVVEYGGYSTSNEAEFMQRKLSYVTEKTVAGLPFLMDYGSNRWVAITEARIRNYPAFYIGTGGAPSELTTKLVPLPGEKAEGIKGRFDDVIETPWRVIMIGDSPGRLIESELIQNLNDPCAIEDPSWIKPGMSAWDHWWSGEVKMEMPVIKQYIDLASDMGWPYMLVDWQWYGKFNDPSADITKWAPQIDMPEIIKYAAAKNVKILVWLYSSDVNRNSAFRKAFPIYRQWGIAGIKIDFMDRDDQYMVNWYLDIIKCAAENKLLVDFHGAYKPDGIIRTWPNMITREGVMGNEYYKFSDKMSPEHNVKLAFTRMLAGQMDYTPGAFLNVTRADFRQQVPALVWNTRAAELSKFVIYESPLTVVCDHPDNIKGKPGADFLKLVPTTWDDTRFAGGYPGQYIAMARRNGEQWYFGAMNNSEARDISFETTYLSPGKWEIEVWADTKNSGKLPAEVKKTVLKINAGDKVKVSMAPNGGWVGIARKVL